MMIASPDNGLLVHVVMAEPLRGRVFAPPGMRCGWERPRRRPPCDPCRTPEDDLARRSQDTAMQQRARQFAPCRLLLQRPAVTSSCVTLTSSTGGSTLQHLLVGAVGVAADGPPGRPAVASHGPPSHADVLQPVLAKVSPCHVSATGSAVPSQTAISHATSVSAHYAPRAHNLYLSKQHEGPELTSTRL